MYNFESLNPYIIPALIIIGGFISGLIIEKLLLAILRKISAKKNWSQRGLDPGLLKSIIVLLFIILSVYIAMDFLTLNKSVTAFFDKLLPVLIIIVFTLVVVRILVGLIRHYTQKEEGVPPTTSIIINIVKLVVYIIGFTVILQSLGISITPMLTALGIGGLAVALALQDTLSNLFAGLHIIASGQIKPGDFIKLESSEEGFVIDITWRVTTIRMLRDNIVIVPNSKLASSVIINYSKPVNDLSVPIDLGVSYDSDLKKVEKITVEVAKKVLTEVEGGMKDFEPVIRYKEFGESSINFSVILRPTEFANQFLIKHEFIKRIHERYNKEGIEIPFPIRTVYLKDKARRRK